MWRSQGGRLSASHRRFLCLQKSKGKLLIINSSLCCHKPFLNLYARHEHCNKHFLICNLMFKICISTTDTPLWSIIKYMKFFFPLIKNDHLLILQKRFGLVDWFWLFSVLRSMGLDEVQVLGLDEVLHQLICSPLQSFYEQIPPTLELKRLIFTNCVASDVEDTSL